MIINVHVQLLFPVWTVILSFFYQQPRIILITANFDLRGIDCLTYLNLTYIRRFIFTSRIPLDIR